MVQEDLGGSHATNQAILDRRKQARSAVRLAAWLRDRYEIGSRDLIGHATANDSRLFEDRRGWRIDHTDWPKAETRTFRKRVERVLGAKRSALDSRTNSNGGGTAFVVELPERGLSDAGVRRHARAAARVAAGS